MGAGFRHRKAGGRVYHIPPRLTHIVKRADLQRAFADLAADKARLYHFSMEEKTTQRAELIVFVEDSRVHVLKGSKWPYGKAMSGAELLKYLANHVA